MREKPIIFSTPMVRAILEGRKTQTRRLLRPIEYARGCPYGRPGDRLWVREPHELLATEHGCRVRYLADFTERVFDRKVEEHRDGWIKRPSIFMPRWASRIVLEITNVRAQKLQEISPEDAMAEGISSSPRTAILNFRALWDSLYAERGYGWDKDPWVWAIGFRKG